MIKFNEATKNILELPIGFGIGINHFKSESSMRIKGYTWLFSCISLDYDIKRKLFNRSIIPVLPLMGKYPPK